MTDFRGKSDTAGDYAAFLKQLNNDSLKPVLLLTGEESYLIRQAKDMLIAKYITPGAETADTACFDEENASADAVTESAETFPMFSERRIVLVKDIPPLIRAGVSAGWGRDEISGLSCYIDHPNGNTILVFMSESVNGRSELVKKLKGKASCFSFGRLSEKELRSFAAKKLYAEGLRIRPRDMDILLDRTGYFNKESEYSLDLLVNDLVKIAAHADRGVVKEEDITGAVNGGGETFIFDLLDGISGNDKRRAFEMIHNRLSRDPDSLMSLLGSVISQTEILLEVRELMDSRRGITAAEIHRKTGLNEFRVKKAMGYAGRYSLDKLCRVLDSAYETSFRIISGKLQPRLALELFVAGI